MKKVGKRKEEEKRRSRRKQKEELAPRTDTTRHDTI